MLLPGRDEPLGEVSVDVVSPKGFTSAAILAHGAGGNMESRLLVELQRRLAADSVAAMRFNFLYSESRKRAPDRRAHLEACWRSVADWTRSTLAPRNLFLGGKSMGGRMASHLAAEGYPLDGLFFLGYPLHPPGKTDSLRKDHLLQIRAPMLFVSGSRDPLCRLELLEPVIRALGGRATLHVIDEGDHSFKVPKRLRRDEAEIANEVYNVLHRWIRAVGGERA